MKLLLVAELIGVLALGLIGIIIISNIWICFMSWRDGYKFFYWKD